MITAEVSAVIFSYEGTHMEIISFTSSLAKEFLDKHLVLALPTETVYGLGVKWDSSEAYERLCQVKNRRPDKPIAVMAGTNFDLGKYFEISPRAKKVMNHFLPGPLTCLVKAKDIAPEQTHLGTFIAGIRIPDKKELLDFLNGLNYPLQVTSANISGQQALVHFNDVYDLFKDEPLVGGIIKGSCDSGRPTTVVDLTGDKIKVIRQGEITKEEIEAVFNQD